MRALFFLLIILLFMPMTSIAASQQIYEQTYKQAISMAASGHNKEAIALLQGAVAVLPAGDIWRERMALAAILMDMRQHQDFELAKFNNSSAHTRLADAYLKGHARPEVSDSWLPGVLASIFPGAGHAWQGRWRDALVSAIMVWPMLILTLWAARRRMGPVTLFFAMITAWLWSGSVFSAVSLAERGAFDLYLTWWQGLWQASALPGRPW